VKLSSRKSSFREREEKPDCQVGKGGYFGAAAVYDWRSLNWRYSPFGGLVRKDPLSPGLSGQ